MSTRPLLPACLVLLCLSACLVLAGKVDRHQSLESVARLHGDVFWDLNRASAYLAPVSRRDEIALGDRLAAGLTAIGTPDPKAAQRAAAAGLRLAPHTLRGLPYRFHAVDLPGLNAFALPGGHVYITREMLAFIQNDDELAVVLGHEMAHIDLRHCLERYRYGAAMKKIGAGPAGNLVDSVRSAFAVTYSQAEETDADTRGALLAAQAGFNPRAGIGIFARMSQSAAPYSGGFLHPYLETHPPIADRQRRVEEALARQGK
ncbi:MAG: M48 family metalloprotease [Candidatus Solibacter usitatus]|nr:M48 family metalloprotease [Candidatus Solibacter usitatus]